MSPICYSKYPFGHCSNCYSYPIFVSYLVYCCPLLESFLFLSSCSLSLRMYRKLIPSRPIPNALVNNNARYLPNVVPSRPRPPLILPRPPRYRSRTKPSPEMPFYWPSNDKCYFSCSGTVRWWVGRELCCSFRGS